MNVTTRVDAQGRVCTKCHKYKLWSDFPRMNNQATGFRPCCSQCHNKGQKSGRRNSKLLNTYGLTEFEFEQLKIAQQGKCQICGRSDRKLVVDHLKGTKYVRGLLCDNCNTGIGLLSHSVETLKSAALYLEKHL